MDQRDLTNMMDGVLNDLLMFLIGELVVIESNEKVRNTTRGKRVFPIKAGAEKINTC